MKFTEDYTKEELAEHLNRYVKLEYHTETGDKIISREEYEANKAATERNFKERILAENLECYSNEKSPVNPPELFDGCSLEDYEISKYPNNFVEKMKARAENNDSFYLLGSFGSGKSRFLWSYAKHLYLNLGHRDIVLIRFSDIFKNIEMNYGNHESNDYFKKIMSCKILLVDDIRDFSGRPVREYEYIVDLLDARLEGNKVTCFSSNVGYDVLLGAVKTSERIASRIERILKSRKNLAIFKEAFNKF
jgi:DNA replication protein DnaC